MAEPPASSKRLKLTIAYDGQPWRGWQSLPSGDTIQDQLEAALAKIAAMPVRIHGSGRTDTGVHALAQTAHCDVPASSNLAESAWVSALNAVLPPSIRIMAAELVPAEFHARFDATGKVYRYRIWRPPVMSPFEVGRAWHVFGDMDEDAVRECARILIGAHDFARLSANRGDVSEEERRSDAFNLTRTITRADVGRTDDVLSVEFEGDGFLYKMARLMAGTMVHVARGRDSIEWFRSLLDDPSGVKSHHMAPADGLYLVRVLY